MSSKNKTRPYTTKMPKFFFDHPIYKELNDVIISVDQMKIIPRRWDELEINFKDNSVRCCRLCDEKIYKVSNLHNYNESKDKSVFIAVPLNSTLFQEIYDEYKVQIEIFVFVQISRRVMQEGGYIETDDIQMCDSSEVLESIVSYLISREKNGYHLWINDYLQYITDVKNAETWSQWVRKFAYLLS